MRLTDEVVSLVESSRCRVDFELRATVSPPVQFSGWPWVFVSRWCLHTLISTLINHRQLIAITSAQTITVSSPPSGLQLSTQLAKRDKRGGGVGGAWQSVRWVIKEWINLSQKRKISSPVNYFFLLFSSLAINKLTVIPLHWLATPANYQRTTQSGVEHKVHKSRPPGKCKSSGNLFGGKFN